MPVDEAFDDEPYLDAITRADITLEGVIDGIVGRYAKLTLPVGCKAKFKASMVSGSTFLPIGDLTSPADMTRLAKAALDKRASNFTPRMIARDLELPYGRRYLDVRSKHYSSDVLAGGSSFAPGTVLLFCKDKKKFCLGYLTIIIVFLGINTSMWYVGENGASTAMRLERGAVGAANLLRSGGATAWRIILSPSVPDYCKAVGSLSLVTNMCSNRFCSDGYLCLNCSCPRAALQSPGFFPGSKFLDDNHIQCYDFIQQPGDLVYVSPHTPYFTVSISANICEATNIMPRLLTAVNLPPVMCICSTAVGGIGQIDIEQPLVLVQEITHLTCRKKDCGRQFLTEAALEEHKKVYHVYRCDFCDYQTNILSNFTRHKLKHNAEQRVQCVCECGATVLSDSLARHRRTVKHRRKLNLL